MDQERFPSPQVLQNAEAQMSHLEHASRLLSIVPRLPKGKRRDQIEESLRLFINPEALSRSEKLLVLPESAFDNLRGVLVDLVNKSRSQAQEEWFKRGDSKAALANALETLDALKKHSLL